MGCIDIRTVRFDESEERLNDFDPHSIDVVKVGCRNTILLL
jgi:hypothetical protein